MTNGFIHAPNKLMKGRKEKNSTHIHTHIQLAAVDLVFANDLRFFDDNIMPENEIFGNQMDEVICIESQIKLLVLTILTIVI